MRKWGQREGDRNPDQVDESTGEPRHSHIRELALPALKSVARFLSLESYRSLPKHDRLPDLNLDDPALSDPNLETPNLESPDLDDPDQYDPNQDAPDAALEHSRDEDLLDWDELDIEELAPTPYRRYLFDLRIQGYLEQTRQELSPLLLEGDF